MKKSLPALVLVLIAIAGISFYAGKNSAAVSVDDVSAQQVEQTEEPADANVTQDTEENIADTMATAQEPEKLDPSTLSDDEKLEIFTKVYEFSYQVEEILRGARGEAEINQEEMREQELISLNKSLSELGYKVTSEIKEEYIFWSDTYHPFDDEKTVSSDTKTQQSTGGGTQQTTNENKQQNNSTTTQSSTPNKSDSQIESTTPPVNDNNISTEESQVENENGDVCSGNDAMSLEDWLNAPPITDAKRENSRAHF